MSVSCLSQQKSSVLGINKDLAFGLGLFGIFAILSLFMRPLLPVDETRYLAVAWEMWNSGNYFVPTLNGETYSHKPPMLFWLINLVWSVTGVNEFSARLIGPFCGILVIILTAELAKTLWPDRPGVAGKAALIVATSGVFYLLASLTMFDTLLTVGVLLSVLGLVKFEKTGKGSWVFLFAVGLAIGVLAKGPVIFLHVLPVVAILSFRMSESWRPKKRHWYMSVLSGIFIAVLLVCLWLVPALLMGGADYREAILWTQTAGRVTQSFAHQQPFWFFFALLPVIIWPWGWSPFIWNKQRFKELLADWNGSFCMIWLVAVFLLFSIVSGKQIHYLIPAYPVLALIFAALFEEINVRKRWLGVSILPVLVVFAGLALVQTGLLPIKGAENFVSIFGVVAALIFSVIVIALCKIFGKNSALFALLAPVAIMGTHIAVIEPVGRIYDAQKIGQIINAYQQAGIAVVRRKYHGEYTFAGRLTRPVDLLENAVQIAEWANEHPGGAIVGLTNRQKPDWEPQFETPFRNRHYAVWVVREGALQ